MVQPYRLCVYRLCMYRLFSLTFDLECHFSRSEEETETGASRNTTDHTAQEAETYDSEMGTMTSQQASLWDHAAPEEEGMTSYRIITRCGTLRSLAWVA